jgi:hypothetical protein
MNTRFLLAICSVAALASCSTTYKATTPDDVYFSPPKGNGATTTKTETQPSQQTATTSEYYPAQDSYLRWKVRNPQRWSTFDDYDYQWYAYNNPMTYGYYGYQPWGVYWNSYWSWNSYYNPYCNHVIVVNPKTNATVFNKLRTYTPGTYNNTTFNNANRGSKPVKVSLGSYSPNNSYNNGNSSFGSAVKKIFSNSGSSSSSSDRPIRSYSPSSGGSSGSSGGGRSSGGGGGVSRPGRGG